jgi:hypothetical protein
MNEATKRQLKLSEEYCPHTYFLSLQPKADIIMVYWVGIGGSVWYHCLYSDRTGVSAYTQLDFLAHVLKGDFIPLLGDDGQGLKLDAAMEAAEKIWTVGEEPDDEEEDEEDEKSDETKIVEAIPI